MEVDESSRDTVVPGMPVTVRLETLKNSEKKNVVVSEEIMNSVSVVLAATSRATTSVIAAK